MHALPLKLYGHALAYFLSAAHKKPASLFHLVWNFIDVLGLVNLICSLSQDSRRFTVPLLMGRMDPVSLTVLRSVQRSWIKTLSITAALISYGSDMLGVARACLKQARQEFLVYRSQKDFEIFWCN